ncbi:MAG: para-aminobenzoate synthetase / 4-amino-4-deoxychorismate lyase, partial [Solirubrobacteraceae bacterium]|nr:para-aminobenzoate synthetase / 4-amino-4-deoxychorismate lyase [Solirubrobacteraceae bacterium]
MKRATIHRERLDCSLTALEALPALRGEERPFALLGAWGGGGAILGSRPVRVAAAGEDPFAALDEQPELDGAAPGGPDFVGGGWFGFLGFRLGGLTEVLDPPPPAPVALPDAALAYYDHVLRLDRDGTWWFEALVTPEREEALRERRAELALRLASAPAAPAA